MLNTEREVREQLGQALIARAEADEKIVQLRAMLQAILSYRADMHEAELDKAEAEPAKDEREHRPGGTD